MGLEEDIDDGPCLTCLRTSTVINVDDITHESRWPAFASRGREAGAGSSLSIPLRINGDAVGALNLYSTHAHGLTDADLARAQQFSDQAAGAIALARMLLDREQAANHLERALASRSIIDQALGIIMARTGVDSDRRSPCYGPSLQNTNDKLRDVASRIVEQVSRRRS